VIRCMACCPWASARWGSFRCFRYDVGSGEVGPDVCWTCGRHGGSTLESGRPWRIRELRIGAERCVRLSSHSSSSPLQGCPSYALASWAGRSPSHRCLWLSFTHDSPFLHPRPLSFSMAPSATSAHMSLNYPYCVRAQRVSGSTWEHVRAGRAPDPQWCLGICASEEMRGH
jgi:hypothetical protein